MFLYNYTQIFPIIYSIHDSGLCCACEVCATFNRISTVMIPRQGSTVQVRYRYTLQGRLPPTVAQTIVLPLIPPNIMLFPAGYAMLRLYAASSLPRGHPFPHGHPFAKTPIETQHPLWDALSGISTTSHAAYENPPRAARSTHDFVRPAPCSIL
jgi:hypothetical protein